MLPPQLWIAKKAGGFFWRAGRRVARRRAARRLSFLGMTPKRRASPWRPAALLFIAAGVAAAAELLRRAGSGEAVPGAPAPTPASGAPEPMAAPPDLAPEPIAAPPDLAPEPMAMAPETLPPAVEPPLSTGSAGAARTDTGAAGLDTGAAGLDTGAAGLDTGAAGLDTGAAGPDTGAAGLYAGSAGGTVSEPLDLLDPAATPPETAPVDPVVANQSQDPLDATPSADPGPGGPVDPLSTAGLTAPAEPLDAGVPATGRPEPTPSTVEEIAADPGHDPIVIEPSPVTPEEPDETRPGGSPGPAGRGT
jgi:hypothetical protein